MKYPSQFSHIHNYGTEAANISKYSDEYGRLPKPMDSRLF